MEIIGLWNFRKFRTIITYVITHGNYSSSVIDVGEYVIIDVYQD